MSEPTTLRALADLPQSPVSPAESTLIVIDCQNERLKAANASNLVLAGFMTHMCVNSTARGVFNLGCAPTVMHSASLAAMADLFAVVVPDGSGIPD